MNGIFKFESNFIFDKFKIDLILIERICIDLI